MHDEVQAALKAENEYLAEPLSWWTPYFDRDKTQPVPMKNATSFAEAGITSDTVVFVESIEAPDDDY